MGPVKGLQKATFLFKKIILLFDLGLLLNLLLFKGFSSLMDYLNNLLQNEASFIITKSTRLLTQYSFSSSTILTSDCFLDEMIALNLKA